MKRVFCTILSLLACTVVCAQKIIVDKVDKFTGSKIVETSTVKTSQPDVDYKLRAQNDTVYIHASIEGRRIRVQENDPAKIYLFANGTPIVLPGVVLDVLEYELRSKIQWNSDRSTVRSRILFDYKLVCRIPDDIFALLCDHDISDIRISVTGRDLDYEVDAVMAKKFRKLFNLLR